MSENSKIEWCDHTFNPWEGCTEVSPGCLHCYAANRNARFHGGTAVNWGKGAPRRRTGAVNWSLPLKWHREAAASGVRPRVFCASLADCLDDEVPIEWLADLLELIHCTQRLDWLLLTKRPQNWSDRIAAAMGHLDKPIPQARNLDEALANPAKFQRCVTAIDLGHWLEGKVPENIWIGTTVEDQTRADQRIPELLKIPAKVRFLSCEPLLGPVDLERMPYLTAMSNNGVYPFASYTGQRSSVLHGIDWVICGGESGPKARPMHPDWARSLRVQCAAAGVPFFFKQWGEFREVDDGKMGLSHTLVTTEEHAAAVLADVNNPHWIDEVGNHYAQLEDLPDDVACRLLDRVGKKAAGRLLDGVLHNAFPEGGRP